MNDTNSFYVHVFENSLGYYLFDVNTVKIVEIPRYFYEDLCNNFYNIEKWCLESLEYLESMKSKGLMGTQHVEKSEHPLTEYMEDLVNNKISHITLQVTQNCNLRCEYCIYSGEYANRSHSDERMSSEVMRGAVDYLIKHSRDVENIAISFYGGEPLLEFELIRECVQYALDSGEGRIIKFNFTTNGTLLTPEKLEFLVENDFVITISLDGPEEVHDKHRKFAYSSTGSFHRVMKNLENIYKTYPEYYRSNIMFNTVIDPMNSFKLVSKFVSKNIFLRSANISSTVIDDTYATRKIEYGNEFEEEFQYEAFKVFLWKVGWLSEEQISPLLSSYYTSVKTMAKIIETTKRDSIPCEFHRGGPCVPGIQRLFITTKGELFPCERVSESSQLARIGDLRGGLNINLMKKVLNVEKLTSEKCRSCFAYYFCIACIAHLDDGEKISVDKLAAKCRGIKETADAELSDYIVMKELGYKWELD